MDSKTHSAARVAPLTYLRWPWAWLVICVVWLGIAAYYAGQFRFDASSDTLVVEGDPDLLAYENVVDVFGGDDFLFLTFAPHNQRPLSPESLADLADLVDALADVQGVKGVFSVLDAPLLKSPPISLGELLDGFPTLMSEGVDLALAQKELSESPFFRELLITADADATAIKINLAASERLQAATAARAGLNQADAQGLPPEKIRQVQTEFRQARESFLADRERVLGQIRQIRGSFQDKGILHLGGVPMIASDMIAYVKSDLSVFGGSVVGLMVVALAIFFRRIRWIVLPIATAALSVGYTVGLLGFLDWQATVISSNFVSLLGITTISLTIHLIVQYRELLHTQPDLDHQSLVMATMRSKFAPCFYTALTTIAAFGSLTASGIVPVEYFGWMMCVGIVISFLATYTFFPAVLLLLPKGQPSANIGDSNSFIRALGEFTRWRPGIIAALGVVCAVAAYFGITQVSLDNRFAEYFDRDTEIFQGMRYIDENLGGTIPFDVVLKFPPYEDLSFDDEEDDFFAEDDDPYPERYWFTRGILDRLEQVHRFLDAQPQVGKVISLTALEDFARDFTEGKKLTGLQIVGILGAIPEDLQTELIRPYASPHTGELRLSGRIIESGPGFDREAFRKAVVDFAVGEVNFPTDGIVVTGMMVLFNSMLSQLLDSQIDTLSYVLLAVFVMFLVLLRSLPHALLGMIPNTLASATVIGAMGFAGIPLDMMTTTIAAICIGIGVDDTIHYLHRFREEYARWGDARIAVSFSHASIGRALYYTSLTVMAGFSVLCFSNFVPTVMFGLWTAVAMALALLANLTLLPALLVLTHATKPAQPELRSETV